MTTGDLRRALLGGTLVGMATVTAEALWAVLRPVPELTEFDATGLVGPAHGQPLHIAVVGDSTSTGPGVSTADDIWVRQLARRLDGYRVRITSLAVGGARTGDVRRDQLDAAIESAGDITFVAVGGNDALRGVPLRTMEENLDVIVSRLMPASGLVVTTGVGDLGTIPRLLPPLNQIMRRRGRRVDAVHARVAERHGAVKVDMWGLATHAFRTRPEVFSADLFHPSKEGHEVWADAAYVTIAPHLGLSIDAP